MARAQTWGRERAPTTIGPMLHIYVDADDCAVKREVLRVATRYRLPITYVANRWMDVGEGDSVTMQVVGDGLDAADDWIVEHVATDDIVICQDIPLAARCVKKGARIINARGRLLTDDEIGDALAKRDLLASLREAGAMTGGPKPYGDRDRSTFLQVIDREVIRAQKARKRRGLD